MTEIGKIPPQNLEAEESLLGSLLIDQDSLIKIVDGISADDFYSKKNRIVYETILHLFTHHEPIDILTLGNRLEETGKLQEVGGRTHLVELSNAVPTSAHIAQYAEIVRKKATLRRLLSAASEIGTLGYEESEDLEIVLDRAERTIFAVSQKFLKQTFVSLRDVLSDAFERIDELHRERGRLRGVPTGFKDLDNLLAGLQKSDLVILAARPSVGKTSLALDIIRNVALTTKLPVGLFSLEMSKEQMVDRLICAEAGVDLWKLRTGNLSDKSDDFPRIGNALGRLSDAPIYIDDSSCASVMEIRAKCRRMQSERGLALVVIDYLQLMESRNVSRDGNRTQEITEISRGLKQIARELSVPVLCLSQLNRAVEMSKPAIPKLAHLRESGSIEQDADVVMFIYRKDADPGYRHDEMSPEERTTAEIFIEKHRNGPTGMVKLYWDKSRASFKNLDKKFTPAAVARPTVSGAGAGAPAGAASTGRRMGAWAPPTTNQSSAGAEAQRRTSEAMKNKKEVEPPPIGPVNSDDAMPF